jgi:predicted lipoprotein with Yx(FWY)xxD motif
MRRNREVRRLAEDLRRTDMKISTSGSGRFRLRTVAIAPLAALLALAAAGCGGGSAASYQQTSAVAGAQHATSSVIVKTRKIKGYGTVLVNGSGHTLYIFARDKRHRVTCTGSCTSFWPPMKQKGMHKAKAGGAAKASLIASVKNPGGGRVVTYSKWPLYTYVGDHAAGTASGEALNVNGGRWYVISPAGKVIKSKTSGGGGGTTTTTGGGGWG